MTFLHLKDRGNIQFTFLIMKPKLDINHIWPKETMTERPDTITKCLYILQLISAALLGLRDMHFAFTSSLMGKNSWQRHSSTLVPIPSSCVCYSFHVQQRQMTHKLSGISRKTKQGSNQVQLSFDEQRCTQITYLFTCVGYYGKFLVLRSNEGRQRLVTGYCYQLMKTTTIICTPEAVSPTVRN